MLSQRHAALKRAGDPSWGSQTRILNCGSLDVIEARSEAFHSDEIHVRPLELQYLSLPHAGVERNHDNQSQMRPHACKLNHQSCFFFGQQIAHPPDLDVVVPPVFTISGETGKRELFRAKPDIICERICE